MIRFGFNFHYSSGLERSLLLTAALAMAKVGAEEEKGWRGLRGDVVTSMDPLPSIFSF